MKPASPALIAYLNQVRGAVDGQLIFADAFLFTLRSGIVLGYTNSDVGFTFGGQAYLANSVQVDGLKYKAAVGLDVDRQQVTVAALSSDTIATGASFLQSLRNGAFDGCAIVRYRVFFSDRIRGTLGDGAMLFKGRLGAIDEIARTTA